ncbi:uracil-DNA glycosylase family protein [Pseudobacteriovorax antillogorgiicola]|uniref:Uracil-DNA glycosylase n=1 Tax=Pseudobacteriovorax antillogorgiicola TaxID=1513793 RepID=A0A1Y6BZT2_9BACT|nr:uracil-DNA glycosylase family protein [Pseudobacteriovorax antillogorgiicola]TCS53034.1 uracil-DNA glycosylase [Pseudobacteriovorax antillogorgiicola]SMF26736.1 Uracil-DNA glycosylase [Pseudobacteriovorax antillogorgiicola]
MVRGQSIVRILSNPDRRTVQGVDQAVRLIRVSPDRIEELIDCVFHQESVVAMRAADALEKINRSHPYLLKPYKKRILTIPKKQACKEARWHWCQVVPGLDLTDKQAQAVYETMAIFLEDPSSILRTFALQGIVDLAVTYPKFIVSAKHHIEAALSKGTKAMQARARKLAKTVDLAERYASNPSFRLHQDIITCKACKDLPLGPKPVVRLTAAARIKIVGQAPGIRVHETGIPWNDPSGERLRDWLGVGRAEFYDPKIFALVPMGFCYPGTGPSGDLPPKPICAELWQSKIESNLKKVELTMAIGNYAQNYLLPEPKRSLTERVKHWQDYFPSVVPLPHPSPRNNRWLNNHPWFESELLPELRDLLAKIIRGS